MTTLRLTLRRLISSPAFSLAAILTLALGIGANSFAFGALHALMVRPLPLTDADRLVWVSARTPLAAADDRQGVNTPEATALATRMTTFASVAVIGDRGLVDDSRGRYVQWEGLWVTPSLLEVLGAHPAAGRGFTVEDMGRGGPRAMMISHERWTQDFGSDPAIVGRVLAFADNKHFTVVGVLPAGLQFPLARPPQAGNGSGFRAGVQDFWILGQDNPTEYPGGALIARLAPGATLETAAAEASALASGRPLELLRARDHALGPLAAALPLLQAFALLVLLVACGNLANLFLSRAVNQETDDAIRAALGATMRDRLLARLAESAVLGVTGATLGLAVAWVAQRWLKQTLSVFPVIAERIEVSAPMLVFTAAIGVAAILAFTLLPVVLPRRSAVALILANSGTRTTVRRSAVWRWGLVVGQVTLALALIVGASLLRQSLNRLLSVDAGYDRRDVVTADMTLFVPGAEAQAYFRALHPRLRALPGVEAVGFVHSTPLTGKWTFSDPLVIEGRSGPAPDVAGNFVAYDYFEAMRIPIVAGRGFTERDLLAPRGSAVIIINDVAAQRFFPGENPLGQRIRTGGTSREIVGIVRGTRDVRMATEAVPQWYQPVLLGSSQLVARISGDVDAFADTLRRELLASDPRLIVKRVAPLDTIVSEHVVERRAAATALDAFAAIAFILALTGLYSVIHLGALERRREFAVRVALGAQRRDVLGMVLGQGLAVAAAGVACGTALALASASALESLLFGITATDSTTLATAGAVVIGVCVVAALVPAWKAASADPLSVLRR